MKLGIKRKERMAFKKLTRELEKLVENSQKMRFYLGNEILEMNSDGKIVLLNRKGKVIRRY